MNRGTAGCYRHPIWCFPAVVTVFLIMQASCGNAGSGASETVLPPAGADPERWIVLDGANNTRDIGGYAAGDGMHVRWKMVYRSGELSALSGTGCATFRSLGIRRMIDFRNRLTMSSLFGGDAPCVVQSTPVSLLRITFQDNNPAIGWYVEGVQQNADAYRAAFDLLADPANLPVLYHCAAGKDRSGVMTALLLRLLGVDRDTVISDYDLSNQVGADADVQAIIDLLDEVEREGGIEVYLSAVGISPETQSAIRTNLLE